MMMPPIQHSPTRLMPTRIMMTSSGTTTTTNNNTFQQQQQHLHSVSPSVGNYSSGAASHAAYAAAGAAAAATNPQPNVLLPPSAYAIPMKLYGTIPFAALAFGQSLPPEKKLKKRRRGDDDEVENRSRTTSPTKKRLSGPTTSPVGTPTTKKKKVVGNNNNSGNSSSSVKKRVGKSSSSSIGGGSTTTSGIDGGGKVGGGGTGLERLWRRRVKAVRDTFDGVRNIIFRDYQRQQQQKQQLERLQQEQQRQQQINDDRYGAVGGEKSNGADPPLPPPPSSIFREYALARETQPRPTGGPPIKRKTNIPVLGSPEFSQSLFDSVTRDLSSVIDHVMEAGRNFTDPSQAETLLLPEGSDDEDDDETCVEDAEGTSLLTCTEKLNKIRTGVDFPDEMDNDDNSESDAVGDEHEEEDLECDEDAALLECNERLPPLADEEKLTAIAMMKRMQEEFYSSDSESEDDEEAMLLLECHEELDDEDGPTLKAQKNMDEEAQESARKRSIQTSQQVALLQELTRIIRQKTLDLARQRLGS